MNRFTSFLPIAAVLVAGLGPPSDASANAVSKYNRTSYRDGGIVLRMNAAAGSVLNPGEEISFTYQTSEDAYVVLFNVDTEGYVHLLHPADGEPARATARHTYSVPEGNRARLVVSGETGMEFVFALTVPDRSVIDTDELRYLRDVDGRPVDERYRIDGDPFLAANIIAGELVRGISHRDGVFLDYTYFFVNERVDHPCYLCGECEGSTADPLCDQYQIVAAFDRSSSRAYPLPRAYDLIDASVPESEVQAAYDTDDDPDRVHVTFYPYSAEVRYITRPSAFSYDYWYGYDPFWYDPWYCGWVYYPTWYYPYYGHYYSWSFAWGYWGGYYCSGWYYPRYHYWHDYYRNNYYDYAYRRVNYKSAYKQRSQSVYKGSSSLVALRGQSVKRNDGLKVASSDLRRSPKTRTADVTRKSRLTTDKGVKTTRLISTGRNQSHVKATQRGTGTTRAKSGIRSSPRTNTRSNTSSRTYAPRSSSKSRSSEGTVRSTSRTRGSGKSSVKSAPKTSGSRKAPAVKRSTSRSSSSSSKAKSSSKGSSRGSGQSSSKTKKKG